MSAYSILFAYPWTADEDATLLSFVARGSTAPPPFATATLTAAGFRRQMLRTAFLQAFVITGVPALMGMFGIGYAAFHAASARDLWSTLRAEQAHWGAAALLALHALVTLLAYAVQGGFRSVAFAQSPIAIEATPESLTVCSGGRRLNGPWTHWKLGALQLDPIPEEYPACTLRAFWLLHFDPATGEEDGRVLLTPDEFAKGDCMCARLIHAMTAAQGSR